MRITNRMFNLVVLACMKEDDFIEMITSNVMITNKMKIQMIIYRKLLNTQDHNKLYTKDLNLIAEFFGFFQYMADSPEHINQWLSDSIELSEKEDSEGIYLSFCNKTLEIKKMFDCIANYPREITVNDIFLDSTHVWVYFHEL